MNFQPRGIANQALQGPASYQSQIEAAQATLSATAGRAGQYLRVNEWLLSIRARAIIPGGTCEFDLPSYHAWLTRPIEERSADLQAWIGPLAQFSQALGIVLKLLRESAQHSARVAQAGAFQTAPVAAH